MINCMAVMKRRQDSTPKSPYKLMKEETTTSLLLHMPTRTGYCSHEKHSALIEKELMVKLLGNISKTGARRQGLSRLHNPPVQIKPHNSISKPLELLPICYGIATFINFITLLPHQTL